MRYKEGYPIRAPSPQSTFLGPAYLLTFLSQRDITGKSHNNKALTMASSTPTTTHHGSTTAVHHPHLTPPTATDSISQLLICTWSEQVVAASLDAWTMYPTDIQI
jgi:hypothetical protein